MYIIFLKFDKIIIKIKKQYNKTMNCKRGNNSWKRKKHFTIRKYIVSIPVDWQFFN